MANAEHEAGGLGSNERSIGFGKWQGRVTVNLPGLQPGDGGSIPSPAREYRKFGNLLGFIHPAIKVRFLFF